MPGLSVPAALILGAVIAPTDAVSAVAIGQKLGLPNRVMTILRAKSLINHVAALATYPFTPELTIESTKKRCSSTNSTSGGSTAIVAPAITSPVFIAPRL